MLEIIQFALHPWMGKDGILLTLWTSAYDTYGRSQQQNMIFIGYQQNYSNSSSSLMCLHLVLILVSFQTSFGIKMHA